MKRLLNILLFILLGVTLSALNAEAGSGNEKQLLAKAQELVNNYKDTEALQIYEQILEEAPQSYEALCKASLLHCRIGDRYQDETTKAEHYEKAKTYAMLAYGLNPADAESNYAMAMSIGSLAMVSGARQRLEGINQAKMFVDEALKNDEKHAGAWYLLGRWHFKMANLNVAEITASKIMFGGVSKDASNFKAIKAIQTAIKYSPESIRYYYDLATIYKELDDKDACRNVLEQALALQLTTSEDLELARRCKLMLQQEVR